MFTIYTRLSTRFANRSVRASRQARGVTMVEYALIAAFSLGIIILLGYTLTPQLKSLFDNIAGAL
jgi:Flp pilus assembly pilin Flp